LQLDEVRKLPLQVLAQGEHPHRQRSGDLVAQRVRRIVDAKSERQLVPQVLRQVPSPRGLHAMEPDARMNARDAFDAELSSGALKSLQAEVEQASREAKAESQAFEKVQDSVIRIDNNYRITYVNKVAGEMGNFNPTEVVGKTIWEIYPAFMGTQVEEAFNKAMETKTQVQVSDYYEPLDIYYESRFYPSTTGLLIFTQDVTLQRRAEREIGQAQALADRLIDSLPGVFYFYDINGQFIRWNKRLEEVTGYSAEEIAAMHPSQLFPDDQKAYITERIMGVFQEEVNDAQCDFQTKDGRRIPYYFKAVRIEYKGIPCLLGNGMDTTDQKRAEEDLIRSREKYRLLFESNPLAMWMLSLPDYKVIESNEAAQVQYGYSREEFLDLDIFNLRPAEEKERLLAATNRNFRGLHHAGIWQHLRKDGSMIYVDIISYDIIYEGKPARLILANEMTKKVEAEEKLTESYESIKELTEHLQNIREQERLHMAREIHDELGQLLTVMKMDLSWVNRKMKDEDPAMKSKVTELISTVDKTVVTVRRIASELRPSLLDNLGLAAAMEWHLEEFTRRSEVQHTFRGPEQEPELTENIKIGLFRILQESLTNVGR
ncbi:MAG: PAS domain S-box protein, partial [Pedobacter sp.]